MSAAALEVLTASSPHVTVGRNYVSHDGPWARQRQRGRGMDSTDDDFSRELAGHLPGLHKSARRLCPNPPDAEDLVQATMERAWKSREQFKPGGNLGGWLYRILTHLGIDGKRRARAILVPLPDDLSSDTMTKDDEEVSAVLATAPETALAAVAELPADLRRPLELFVTHKKSYREIAEELAIPVNTVGTRIRRGRLRLMTQFTSAKQR